MAYDVESIRKRLKQSMGGKFNDPEQFRPDTAKSTSDPIKYRFFILPPLIEGEVLKAGTIPQTMDQFFIQHADHWFNNRPTPCPRMWSNNDCPICTFGFDLLREEKDENKRREIIKVWMPTTYYLVNIFFTKWEGNPEELRGKVKFYNAPKTCFDQWTSALLRDDKGDDEEPQAHGVFFDESAAFLFQLEVLRQGRSNSYKTSKFVTSDGEPVPMVGKRGEPHAKGIEILLKSRHNLWEKVEVPDPEKIQRLYRMMAEGDDAEPSDGTTAGGFDDDETEPVAESKKDPKKDTKKAKEQPKESKEPKDQKKDKKSKPVDVEEDDNMPVDDDEVSTELPDKKPVTESEDFDSADDDDDDDVGSSEIDALLNQLQDDDE